MFQVIRGRLGSGFNSSVGWSRVSDYFGLDYVGLFFVMFYFMSDGLDFRLSDFKTFSKIHFNQC
jgi:hypothetical protein